MEFKHLFTLEEAQSVLAEVQPRLARLIELKRTCDQKGYDVFRHQYFGGMGPNGQKAFPLEMEELVAIMTDFNERGIEVKDLDKGLIDFPHRRANGETVYLCYLSGEPAIVAWHGLDDGFRGRQSLSEL